MATIEDIIGQNSIDQVTKSSSTSKDVLGKDAFLNLLVTQLKYQDPLDPVKNEEFVAQLAQFNSLEQMINLNKSFESMLYTQKLAQATNLIGAPVAYDSGDESGTLAYGEVSAVVIQDGEPMLQIGTSAIPLSSVVSLGPSNTPELLTQASYLIGKKVSWLDTTDQSKQSGVVDSAELVNGVAVLNIGTKQISLGQVYAVAAA